MSQKETQQRLEKAEQLIRDLNEVICRSQIGIIGASGPVYHPQISKKWMDENINTFLNETMLNIDADSAIPRKDEQESFEQQVKEVPITAVPATYKRGLAELRDRCVVIAREADAKIAELERDYKAVSTSLRAWHSIFGPSLEQAAAKQKAAENRAEKAEAIIAKLPKTADGIPIVPGIKLYPLHPLDSDDRDHCEVKFIEWASGAELDSSECPPSSNYSSPEAAALARHAATGEGEMCQCGHPMEKHDPEDGNCEAASFPPCKCRQATPAPAEGERGSDE